MVFIETIRNLICLMTLAVRLAANIIAGHLLLPLLLSDLREKMAALCIITLKEKYLFQYQRSQTKGNNEVKWSKKKLFSKI